MKVKNVWKATWFSFIAGFMLVTFVSLCVLFDTNDMNSIEDVYIVLFVLMIMGAVYALVQISFSFLVNIFLADRELTPGHVLLLTLKIMLFLYVFVFFICCGISGFRLRKEDLQFISGFSIPYVLNCFLFVFRLHYLCWKDTQNRTLAR